MKLTVVLLAVYMGECDGVVDTALPRFALECEEGLLAVLRDWRQLEEVSGYDKLGQPFS